MMKILITAKTGKKESTEKEIDRTVDEVMKIASKIEGKIISGKCFCDGTQIIMKR